METTVPLLIQRILLKKADMKHKNHTACSNINTEDGFMICEDKGRTIYQYWYNDESGATHIEEVEI